MAFNSLQVEVHEVTEFDSGSSDDNICSPISTEIALGQPTCTVGLLGDAAHGKNSVVKALLGKHVNRLEVWGHSLSILQRMKYTNIKLFRCSCGDCERPACFTARDGKQRRLPPCLLCGACTHLARHVSLVTFVGNDSLVGNLITGAAAVDAVLLILAADAECPTQEAEEQLAAAEMAGISHYIILQTKVDLVTRSRAMAHYALIKQFVAGTRAEGAPIVPVSSVASANIDVVAELLAQRLPRTVRDLSAPALLHIVNSLDVNKPGSGVESIRGGVVQGCLQQGVLRVGSCVEMRPGLVRKLGTSWQVTPMYSRVVKLSSGSNTLDYAVPGAPIQIELSVDPTLTAQDKGRGQLLGAVGTLPHVFAELEVKCHSFRGSSTSTSMLSSADFRSPTSTPSGTAKLLHELGATVKAGTAESYPLAEQGSEVSMDLAARSDPDSDSRDCSPKPLQLFPSARRGSHSRSSAEFMEGSPHSHSGTLSQLDAARKAARHTRLDVSASDTIMLHVGATHTAAEVLLSHGTSLHVRMAQPMCVPLLARVAVSTNNGKGRWLRRYWGTVQGGVPLPLSGEPPTASLQTP